jgi:hypothetical protein
MQSRGKVESVDVHDFQGWRQPLLMREDGSWPRLVLRDAVFTAVMSNPLK